jgi:hypothetical protein
MRCGLSLTSDTTYHNYRFSYKNSYLDMTLHAIKNSLKNTSILHLGNWISYPRHKAKVWENISKAGQPFRLMGHVGALNHDDEANCTGKAMPQGARMRNRPHRKKR